MASIDLIRASDGSGNASAATVQSIRSGGATTIDVDTVQGIPDTFSATMGTPHTFTDPVTSETITVISEATAVDFTGHVDGSNLEIDDIAPGYTDNGSAVGDIIIIRPTTQWADNVADVLAVSHNDDGTLKAVTESPGYTALAYTPNTVTCNGNRSYSLTFNSVNLTTALSAGMRLRTTRTVTAPTQCTSLNGTSQYFSKSSPAGMTFTDDFVVSAWVKLTSYNGTIQMIASRYNGTSGWYFYVTSSGQIALAGVNGGAANISQVISYQSVPLNRWVHVAAQLDMSTFTATTSTSYVMFDGLDVPASVSRGGTNPTALVQAGNLEIGSDNGGLLPFGGKIAQVAIYSAKVTQANIRATISQGLSGTETSLASAYSFNNSIADLNTSTPNDLTAQGSAVATNADSPFGGQADGTISSTLDYAIITKTAFSTNTTLTVQVPEGCTIPTTGGVSAMSYSTQKAPFGFPAARNRWEILWICKPFTTFGNGGTNFTWQSGPSNGIFTLLIPVGDWEAGYDANRYQDRGATVYLELHTTFSTSNSTESDSTWTVFSRIGQGSGLTYIGAQHTRYGYISLSAATNYYLVGRAGSSDSTVGNHGLNNGGNSTSIMKAIPAHL